jgi:hypothetical protein
LNKKQLKLFSYELAELIQEIEEDGMKYGINQLSLFLIQCQEENLFDPESGSIKELIDIFKKQAIESNNIKDFNKKKDDYFIKKSVYLICKSYDDGYSESEIHIKRFMKIAAKNKSIKNFNKKDVIYIINEIFLMFDRFEKDRKEGKINEEII